MRCPSVLTVVSLPLLLAAWARAGPLVLYVDSSGSDVRRPVPHAIATLQEQEQPSSSLANDSLGRAVPVAWGQADSVGQIVLPLLPAGRYPSELLAWQHHPWTGHFDVRAGYTDTVRSLAFQ
jgi:hypothetical protein